MLGTLLKVYLRGMLSGLKSGRRKNGTLQSTSKWSIVGLAVLFVVAFAALGYVFFEFIYAIGSVTKNISPWLIYALMGLLVFLVDFFMTIFTAKSQLFEAKDNELLLSLPVRPRDILLARMLAILLIDYLFELIITVPVMVAWCMLGQFTIPGLFCFILSLLFMPLLALSLACLVGWVLSLIAAHVSRPQVVSTVLSIIFLALYIAFCLGMNTYAQLIVTNANAVSVAIQKIFPMFAQLGYAITYGNFLSLLYYALWMIIPFVITCIILACTFVHIITTKRGGVNAVYREKNAHVRSHGIALLVREFRHLISSATYMMNAGLGLLFLPICGIAAFFVVDPAFAALIDSIPGMDAKALFPAGAALVLIFVSSLTMFTASSISLEGHAIYDLKALPIRGRSFLFSKLAMQLILITPLSLLASLLCMIALPCTPLMGLLLFVAPMIFNVFYAVFGLAMNIAFPAFDWVSETAVIKQSKSVCVTMIMNMFGTMLLSFGAVMLFIYVPTIPIWALLLMLCTIPLVASVVLLIWMAKRGDKILAKMG